MKDDEGTEADVSQSAKASFVFLAFLVHHYGLLTCIFRMQTLRRMLRLVKRVRPSKMVLLVRLRKFTQRESQNKKRNLRGQNVLVLYRISLTDRQISATHASRLR